jgi:hypothetical protein
MQKPIRPPTIVRDAPTLRMALVVCKRNHFTNSRGVFDREIF